MDEGSSKGPRFKIGDKVRVVDPTSTYDGKVGYVDHDIGTSYLVRLGPMEVGYWFKPSALVLAGPTPESGFKDTNPKDLIASNKVPLWLCSPIAAAKWAVAQLAGLLKYGAWNWRIAGVRSSVYLSAARRHLDAYLSGEEVDPRDGTDHRANVMACMAILIDAEAAGKLTDDRPPSVGVRKVYAEQEALMAKLRAQYEDRDPKHYTIADTEESTEAA